MKTYIQTGSDGNNDRFNVEIEEFIVPAYFCHDIAYPHADWLLSYDDSINDKSNRAYDPDKDDLPIAALFCVENDGSKAISEYAKIKNDLRKIDDDIKIQFRREERSNNPRFNLPGWRVLDNGYYLDSRLDALDVYYHANKYHSFKNSFYEEFPDNPLPTIIKGQDIRIYHPCITYMTRSTGWRPKILNILYQKSSRHHPIHLVSIDDCSMSLWRSKRQGGSPSVVIHIRPGSPSYYRLSSFGTWSNVPRIEYDNNAFRIKTRDAGISSPKRRIAMFNIPHDILASTKVTHDLCFEFRNLIKRLMCFNLIVQMVDNDYRMDQLDMSPLLHQYIDVQAVIDHANLSQNTLNDPDINMESQPSPDNSANSNHKSAIELEVEAKRKAFFAAMVADSKPDSSDYNYSAKMVDDMLNVMNSLSFQPEDFIDVPMKAIREWALDTLHSLQHLRSFNPVWPPCISSLKLQTILNSLAPPQFLSRLGYSFNHRIQYNNKTINVTPAYTKDINVDILVGNSKKNLPCPLIQTGHKRCGASLYDSTPATEYMSTQHQCNNCGLLCPPHTNKGCEPSIKYKLNEYKRVDLKGKSSRWSNNKIETVKNSIVSKRCTGCGDWGHLAYECPRSAPCMCVNCGGGHRYSIECRSCLLNQSLAAIIKNAECMLYEFHLTNINDLSKEQILTFFDEQQLVHNQEEKQECLASNKGDNNHNQTTNNAHTIVNHLPSLTSTINISSIEISEAAVTTTNVGNVTNVNEPNQTAICDDTPTTTMPSISRRNKYQSSKTSAFDPRSDASRSRSRHRKPSPPMNDNQPLSRKRNRRRGRIKKSANKCDKKEVDDDGNDEDDDDDIAIL